MTSADRPDAPGDTPTLYEIRVRGAFDQKWRGLLEGMTLEVVHEESQSVTVIRVVVRDQAALAGLLDALFGLNARVLSVTALEAA
jgi:hypothetical protein